MHAKLKFWTFAKISPVRTACLARSLPPESVRQKRLRSCTIGTAPEVSMGCWFTMTAIGQSCVIVMPGTPLDLRVSDSPLPTNSDIFTSQNIGAVFWLGASRTALTLEYLTEQRVSRNSKQIRSQQIS